MGDPVGRRGTFFQSIAIHSGVVGGIFTSKETDRGHNRVAGADLETRFWSSISFLFWAANVMDSRPRDTNDTTGDITILEQYDDEGK